MARNGFIHGIANSLNTNNATIGTLQLRTISVAGLPPVPEHVRAARSGATGAAACMQLDAHY